MDCLISPRLSGQHVGAHHGMRRLWWWSIANIADIILLSTPMVFLLQTQAERKTFSSTRWQVSPHSEQRIHKMLNHTFSASIRWTWFITLALTAVTLTFQDIYSAHFDLTKALSSSQLQCGDFNAVGTLIEFFAHWIRIEKSDWIKEKGSALMTNGGPRSCASALSVSHLWSGVRWQPLSRPGLQRPLPLPWLQLQGNHKSFTNSQNCFGSEWWHRHDSIDNQRLPTTTLYFKIW